LFSFDFPAEKVEDVPPSSRLPFIGTWTPFTDSLSSTHVVDRLVSRDHREDN